MMDAYHSAMYLNKNHRHMLSGFSRLEILT